MKKDYEAYLKRPTPGQNIIKMGIPDRKFKFIKRYQTGDYQNPLYNNTVFKRSYNDKLAPQMGQKELLTLQY